MSHAQWERLVIGAVVFYFVGYVLFKSAVLALLVRQMLVLALAEALPKEVVIALVLYEFVIFLRVGATFVVCPGDHFHFLLLRIFFWGGLNHSAIAILKRIDILTFLRHRFFHFFEYSAITVFLRFFFGALGFLLLNFIISLHLLLLRQCRHLRSLICDE